MAKEGEIPAGVRIREAYSDEWKPIRHPALARIGLETCYTRPFTVAALQKIGRLADGDRLKTLVYTLVEMLHDEDLDKVFTVKDIPDIENYLPSDAIAQISDEINKTGGFGPYSPGKSGGRGS